MKGWVEKKRSVRRLCSWLLDNLLHVAVQQCDWGSTFWVWKDGRPLRARASEMWVSALFTLLSLRIGSLNYSSAVIFYPSRDFGWKEQLKWTTEKIALSTARNAYSLYQNPNISNMFDPHHPKLSPPKAITLLNKWIRRIIQFLSDVQEKFSCEFYSGKLSINTLLKKMKITFILVPKLFADWFYWSLLLSLWIC